MLPLVSSTSAIDNGTRSLGSRRDRGRAEIRDLLRHAVFEQLDVLRIPSPRTTLPPLSKRAR